MTWCSPDRQTGLTLTSLNGERPGTQRIHNVGMKVITNNIIQQTFSIETVTLVDTYIFLLIQRQLQQLKDNVGCHASCQWKHQAGPNVVLPSGPVWVCMSPNGDTISQDVHSSLNGDTYNMWWNVSRMSLTPAKSKVLPLTFTRNTPIPCPFRIECQDLKVCDGVKSLGVMVQNDHFHTG
jgi:hypothetical protein